VYDGFTSKYEHNSNNVDTYKSLDYKFVGTYNKVDFYYKNSGETIDLENHTTLTDQHLPLLKSNLQKCIRRCEYDKAIVTANIILRINSLELLRRILIIVVEDTCITDNMPYSQLTWLMMAHKNHQFTMNDYKHIVNMIWIMCNTMENVTYDNVSTDYTVDYFNQIQVAVNFRIEYGGMNSDMQLLKNLCSWLNKHLPFTGKTIPILDYNYLFTLTNILNNILLDAIDFHCFPPILALISKEYNIDRSNVKKLIWDNYSSINIRRPQNNIIKPIFHDRYLKIRQDILDNLYMTI
jgi:hypothetical protein